MSSQSYKKTLKVPQYLNVLNHSRKRKENDDFASAIIIQEVDMKDQKDSIHNIEPVFNFDDLKVKSNKSNASANNIIMDASSEISAAKAGLQTNSLQSAINNYAMAMNESAIAESTGLPVRTPSQQYKGFIAEEYLKNSMKINALAAGVPDWKIGIYTKGTMPDGSVLSGIDMETDISVWTREQPWSRPMRTVDYQSKIYNDPAKYAKAIRNPQYENVEFVGGAGQGINDTIKVRIGNKIVSSDSVTPEEAVKMADEAKAQSTSKYSRSQEKFDELNKVNMDKAVKAGAATGFILTATQEIIDVIKNRKNLSEDQFVRSIENILCGTVEGGLQGGAINESVQILGKILGREVASNSFEAIPAMVVANVAVDFAKDLYKCFVAQTIDTDDLLCNSVNNVYTSAAGFSGAWAVGQIGGQVAENFSSQAFIQGIGMLNSAKAATATGAAIGSSLGPIGTIIGSVVGGIVIGIGAKAIIGSASKDAYKAYCDCIDEINIHLELEGFSKAYYFADTMECLSDFRLSFKDLLPCYNLISDLQEYNLHKKAMRGIEQQLKDNLINIDVEKQKVLKELDKRHKVRMRELRTVFSEQRNFMVGEFRESVNTYISDSYIRYLSLYEVMEGNTRELLGELEQRKTEHSYILTYMNHRNEVNIQINSILHQLMESTEDLRILSPFIDKLIWYMQQDELLIGKQYISFNEAVFLIHGGPVA